MIYLLVVDCSQGLPLFLPVENSAPGIIDSLSLKQSQNKNDRDRKPSWKNTESKP